MLLCFQVTYNGEIPPRDDSLLFPTQALWIQENVEIRSFEGGFFIEGRIAGEPNRYGSVEIITPYNEQKPKSIYIAIPDLQVELKFSNAFFSWTDSGQHSKCQVPY